LNSEEDVFSKKKYFTRCFRTPFLSLWSSFEKKFRTLFEADLFVQDSPGRQVRRVRFKNVRLGEADGLKNFHPQKWVPNAIK